MTDNRYLLRELARWEIMEASRKVGGAESRRRCPRASPPSRKREALIILKFKTTVLRAQSGEWCLCH